MTKKEFHHGKQIGAIRIARVEYDFEPVRLAMESETAYSLGAMIDHHISARINAGQTISEVTLMFETMDQQNDLKQMYLPVKSKY